MQMGKRREKLVYAIIHNVQYLSKLHHGNMDEMRDTRKTLEQVMTHN